jgi:hypothetical protein
MRRVDVRDIGSADVCADGDHRHGRISRCTHTGISRASATLMSAASRELRARKRHRRPQIASRVWEFQGASPSFKEREAERRKAHLGNSRGVFPGSPGNRGTRQRLAASRRRRLKDPGPLFRGLGSWRFRAARLSPSSQHTVADPCGPGGNPRPPETVLARHAFGRRISRRDCSLRPALALSHFRIASRSAPSLDRTRRS